MNIEGTTLHMFCGVRDGRGTRVELVARVRADPGAYERWRTCRLLVVDEVSMLDADLLERLDAVARAIREVPERSFGGMQVLLLGDFLQLPPVGPRVHPDHGASPAPRMAFQNRPLLTKGKKRSVPEPSMGGLEP